MATSSLQLSDQIQEEFLQCKICFEVYRTPRTLSCLHSFCEPCLEQLLEKGQGSVCCPECRTVTDLQGCVRNAKASFFINSLLDLFRSKTDTQAVCSLCPSLGKTPDPASNRCLDCADFLCAPCAQGHRCSKLTLGHSVVSLQDYASGRYDEEARGKQERHCQSHQDPLRFYCSTCSTPICRDCRMLDHFSHQVLSLTQAAADRKPQLEGLIGSLDGSVKSLSQQEQEVDSALQELKETESIIKDQLSGYVSVLIDQLFAQKDAVCAELSSFVEEQEKNYLTIKQDLLSHISSAQSTKVFSRQVMQMGKDYEILDLESSIQSHIERLQKLSIPAVGEKTPLLVFNEDAVKDRFRTGMFQLRFDPSSDPVEDPNGSNPSVKPVPEKSTQISSETNSQPPITPNVLQIQSQTQASAVLLPKAQNPVSVAFLRSLETDDDNNNYTENITGISLFPGGDIVIADNSNLVIKRFIRNGVLRSTFSTDNANWDNLNPFSLVVCDETIYFTSGSRLYKLTDDGDIVQVCNLRGSHSEYAIASYNNEYIAVSEGTSCCLSLYDARGGLVGRVQPPDGGRFVFMAINRREEFIVSDTMKKCIYIFNQKEEVINICSSADSGTFNPRSICVDKWDNILAVDGVRVHLLSPRGEFVRVLLDLTGQKYVPKLITADDRGHLIMTDRKGTIRIYKMSY
ncbi:E3 ubiquitin-protein ligase TRIM56 [Amia ocellicauda]|uniref:E3 ubiquitin-protein ligase TRIM56 n=1 Tax=Amia ocellicauda TaxID=2972642 RepID=UPI0034649A36